MTDQGDHQGVIVQHSERLTRLEDKVAAVEKQQQTDQADLQTVTAALGKVTSTLNQVKWVAIGIAAAAVGQETGLLQLLKKWLLAKAMASGL